MIKLTDINEKSFSLTVKNENNRIEIIFSGQIDIPNPEIIVTPFFTKLDSEIISANINEVYFNVSKLDFINSSGIKVILQYIMSIIRRPEKQQYNIIIKYNEGVESQKTRFNSILFLAPKIIRFVPVKS